MNILITGSNGFIGRNLFKLLKTYNNKYNIFTLNRTNADLLDADAVDNYFSNHKIFFDLVIHTSIQGGRRNIYDSGQIVYNNILMLYNLLRNQNHYQHIISFGSGAELDRRYDINPQATNRYPIDPYGLSKSIIDKICMNEHKLCNFRIYNCFGLDEQPNRMIRGNITKYINSENIIIHKDRRMDFFFIDDLAKLIHFCIRSNNIPKFFDCCYKEKLKLSDIANIINNLDTHKVNIEYESDSLDTDYIGKYIEMNIPYFGLENSIEFMYNTYKNKGKI
jgi:nucleoside-diphosphate-sugar epimerase